MLLNVIVELLESDKVYDKAITLDIYGCNTVFEAKVRVLDILLEHGVVN